MTEANHYRFGNQLYTVLHTKGIDSLSDLENYSNTTEGNGELIINICEMFQTEVLLFSSPEERR